YEPMLQPRRAGLPPANRPGLPPVILTWADAKSLAEFTADLRALRTRADIVVASHHWGLFEDVLDYQVEIAHAAIDAGADVVMGHGPHYACAVQMYRGKPIFYGLGSFSFHTGHGGRAHGDWVGPVGRGAHGQHGLQLLPRLLVAPYVDVELRQLDPRPRQPWVETPRGLEVLLGFLSVTAQDHRQLACDATGHDVGVDVAGIEPEHRVDLLAEIAQREGRAEQALGLRPGPQCDRVPEMGVRILGG